MQQLTTTFGVSTKSQTTCNGQVFIPSTTKGLKYLTSGVYKMSWLKGFRSLLPNGDKTTQFFVYSWSSQFCASILPVCSKKNQTTFGSLFVSQQRFELFQKPFADLGCLSYNARTTWRHIVEPTGASSSSHGLCVSKPRERRGGPQRLPGDRSNVWAPAPPETPQGFWALAGCGWTDNSV